MLTSDRLEGSIERRPVTTREYVAMQACQARDRVGKAR